MTHFSFLGSFLALSLVFQYASLESAPALVWSNQEIRSPDSAIRFNTLVDQIDPNDLLVDYVKNKIPIVAFVQKDLSVEQFAANDAPYVSAIFDNLEVNPVLYTNVKTPQKIYSSFKTNAPVNENMVIYLPGNNLKENDEIIKAHTEKLNASGPVVFILTGESNKFLEAHKRVARAASDPKVRSFGYYPTDPANRPCVLFSSTGAIATLYKTDDAKDDQPVKFYFTGSPTLEAAGSSCIVPPAPPTVNDVTAWAGHLQLKFSNESEKNDLTLTFQFTNSTNSMWSIDAIEAQFSGSIGNFDASSSSLPTVPSHLSFSCQKAIFPINGTSEYKRGTVQIQAFQIQPYYTPTAEKTTVRFDSSSDCAVWFTLPIWMGLIVSLVLIAILYSGVVALMSIITPDRFENPKGRGLIITNVEE